GRLLLDGRVALRAGSDLTVYAGVFPLCLDREPACQLPLRDPGISRRHVEIVEVGGRFRVRDAGSKNGTTLGGVRIAAELPLDGGDRVELAGDGDHVHLAVE